MTIAKSLDVKGETHRLDLTANIYQGDKWLVAECPELGTVSQGKTVEEAVSNLAEATPLYLEDNPSGLDNLSKPPINFEQEVRELEVAYSRYIGQAVEPAQYREVATMHFTVEVTYA